MRITVIIPTRNRSALLARTLESLCYQSYPIEQFEIRVIDNDSTDQTAAICQQFSNKLPNLIYHHNPVLGLHAGRHVGLKAAKGDITVFTDDDVRAYPSWIEGIAMSFADPDVVLIGGKCLPDYESPPPSWLDTLWVDSRWGQWLGYYTLLDFGDEIREISPLFVWGCNFAIRKKVVFELGGFHPDGMPKDLIRYRGDGETSLSRNVLSRGYKTLYNPAASVYHFVSAERMTKDYVKWRSYIQGISDSYTHIRQSQGIKLQDEVIALIKHIIKRVRHLNRPLRKMISDSYLKGYRYHRHESKKDPQLLAWVLKNNYM